MLKKILSYLIPINVFQKKSVWSKNLEITWNNGQLVLDSKNTNYSYGSLQRILRIGLKEIGFSKIESMNTILVLGVAGGSVIKTLVDETGFKGNITGVEIDSTVIELANEYFQLNEIPNLEIILADAQDYIASCQKKFDLIIIDIFQDKEMPDFLFKSEFINRLAFLVNPDGVVLFNTMILDKNDILRNQEYISHLNSNGFNCIALPKLEQYNELIISKKGN
ncbi:MAG: spermidine synthase [Flavobacterium sp.]